MSLVDASLNEPNWGQSWDEPEPADLLPLNQPQKVAQRQHFKQVTVGQPVALDTAYEFRQFSVRGQLESENQALLKEAQEKAFQLEEAARNEALQTIEKAHQRAADIVAEAEAQAEAFYNEGVEKGYQDGLTQGIEAAAEHTASLLEQAERLSESAYTLQKRVLKDFRKDAVDMMGYTLNRILGEAFFKHPQPVLEAIATQAVESLHLSGKVRLVVHPTLLERLKATHPITEQALGTLNRFSFEVDPLLREDQVFVLGAEGRFDSLIDVSLNSQVEKLLAPLKKALPFPPALNDALDNPQGYIEKKKSDAS